MTKLERMMYLLLQSQGLDKETVDYWIRSDNFKIWTKMGPQWKPKPPAFPDPPRKRRKRS